MRVGVVCSTLGRVSLTPLLTSLENQTVRPELVVIVDQSPADGVHAEIVEASVNLRIRHVRSQRVGLSAGRNDGIACLSDDVEIVAFPDDDCRPAPNALEVAAVRLSADPELFAVAGRLITDGTSNVRTRSGRKARQLRRGTVWWAMEPAVFFRRSALAALDGFDERLGTGAATPWQSGEGTDLLLRAMLRNWRVVYDPAVEVHETDPRRYLTREAQVEKARRYAQGTGLIYGVHYPRLLQFAAIAAPLGRAVVSVAGGDRQKAREYFAVFRGRSHGVRTSARYVPREEFLQSMNADRTGGLRG